MPKIKERNTILNIQNGELMDRIDGAVAGVMANINDMRLDPTKKRSITISLTFSSDEDRRSVKCETSVVSKLVNEDKMKASLWNYEKLDARGNKVHLLQEQTNSPVGQIDINGEVNMPLEVAYQVEDGGKILESKQVAQEQVIQADEVYEDAPTPQGKVFNI